MKRSNHFSASLCLILTVYAIDWAQKPELVVETGHSNAVESVAFSPDGKTLASGSSDKAVKLWDVSTGTEMRTLNGHSDRVVSVAFSPDGKTLASGSSDNTIRLWDVWTGRALRTIKGRPEEVSALSCPGPSIAFSADGKALASGILDSALKLWDVSTGAELRTFRSWSGSLNSLSLVSIVAFSPDGRTLASRSLDYVELWDVSTGTELHRLKGHSNSVTSLAFSSDGKTLVSGSWDNTVKLWNVSTGLPILTLKGHSKSVGSIAFSSDGRTVASGGGEYSTLSGGDSDDKMIELWDVSTGTELHRLRGHSNLVTSLAFSADGKTLASGSVDHTIKLWDVSSGTELRALKEHSHWVYSAALSPDGKTLASGSLDNMVRLWSVSSGTALRRLKGHSQGVVSVAFSPNGKSLASGSQDNTIKLWDVSTGTEVRTFKGHSGGVYSVAFSPDSKTLVSGSLDDTIKLWDVSSGTVIRTLGQPRSALPPFTPSGPSVAFSPDGKTIARGGGHTIKLWDVSTGTELRAFRNSSGTVSAIAFKPDGKTLASGSDDNTVKLWDVSTGKQLRTLKGHSNFVESVAFSPDGGTLASGSWDNTAKLWDVATGAELHTLKGHTNLVFSVAFSADGKTLASGSGDSSVKLWRVADGAALASLIALDEKDWIVITPDGLFDGSPAAWNQMLWRFNNDTFNYAPVEAFFGDFFYPGLLADLLAGKRPKARSDISQKDRRQPQLKLELADAQAKATLTARNVTVKIDVVSRAADKDNKTGSGARDVRLFRNGSLIRVWHGDVLKGRSSVTLEATVPIVAGENQLTAYAFNHDNIKSSDVTVVVNGADSLTRTGTLYVLAVGSNKYKSAGYDLKFALADVDEISKQVKAHQDKLGNYVRTEAINLTNDEATKANIILVLRRFADGSEVKVPQGISPTLKQQLEKVKAIEPEDGLVIYYAGHGTAIGQHFYLLPHDFVAGNEEQLKDSGISDIELNEVLERVDAGKLLMVIDACQSGQVLGGEKEGRGPMNSKGLAQLAYDKGMYILTAAQSYQAAKEVSRSQAGKKIEHGLLTFALLEGLTKAKLDGEGKITEREWMNYAVDQVPLMQIEEMKKRSAEVKQRSGPRQRSGELVFVGGDNGRIDPEKRNVQRPRVFYRRELEDRPLIVAKQ